jgi:hypothetical protein
MEGWKKKSSQKLPSLQEERVEVMNELEEIESGMRRQESKRKGDNIKERRSKKRKYSRLTGWGEPEMVSTLQEDWMTRESEDLMTRKQILAHAKGGPRLEFSDLARTFIAKFLGQPLLEEK